MPKINDYVRHQPVSIDIWDKKYRLKDHDQTPIDLSMRATYQRVAKALADVEPILKDEWYADFLWALDNGAIPAGRILSNLGAGHLKPNTSTINCTVSKVIPDSMAGIMESLTEAALTLKAGCGIGYDFSTLRPRGASVRGVGAVTSGPLPFMDIFDKMCFTVSSAGGRRGAQMATMDISHPDIVEFIKAKREDGRLRQFNLSILITNDFMETVQRDGPWLLTFPYLKTDSAEDHVVLKAGVPHKVYSTIKAKELWELIMKSTYDYAEPGFILIDQVNSENNNWWCEDIRATNPCGEQPLPPYGSCLLGSVNLTACLDFDENPKAPGITFNHDRFRNVVRIFSRMLDNVVELHGLPLSQQAKEIASKRRHGMGFLGLGSTLALLGLKYGSKASCAFADKVARTLAIEGLYQATELAQEKGMAPVLHDGHLKDWLLSGYMQRIKDAEPELHAQLAIHGARYTHHTSIAPTGTISLSLANNASNGIEPSFAHEYIRNVIVEGRNTKEAVTVYSYERLAWRSLYPDLPEPESFVTSDQITPMEHLAMQAAVQPWIDSAISKTINVPSDYPFEDFKDIYTQGWKLGLKGCTTFRFNPEVFQGVLVKEDDLKKTTYQFNTESGEAIEITGDQMVEYEGQTQTAANLFDALKEGYFGRL